MTVLKPDQNINHCNTVILISGSLGAGFINLFDWKLLNIFS